MKIKELMYEWILFWANVWGCENRNGFFDNKRIYRKIGWLNWKVDNFKVKGDDDGK